VEAGRREWHERASKWKKRKRLRISRRGRGGWTWGGGNDAGGPNGNCLNLAVFTTDREGGTVELEVERGGVADLGDDIFVAVEGAFVSGFKDLRIDGFAIDDDGEPAGVAGDDGEDELAGSFFY
jgi:hypothetical protein